MKSRLRLFFNVIFCLLLVMNQIPIVSAQKPNISLSTLTKGQKFSGFRAEAVYVNDADQPMGARFTHERTGFTLDLLEIQSVPQAYYWVNSFPVSDQGEPHTQEHLLITKGNKGRNLNGEESMSLAQSNAYTLQYTTAYEFNTAAGSEVFYSIFTNYLDSLLHPDYTDEEVRREVRNWGVAENPDKTLRIEEKGSVFNEMVSSMNNPDSRLYQAMGLMLFGKNHPFSFNAGGLPSGIRTMKPDDIKRFHEANYHLANMGAIVSVPKSMTLQSVLTRMNAILNKLQPDSRKKDFMTVNKIPPFFGTENGKIEIVEYPAENEQQPATMLFAYNGNFQISTTEKVLLDNFLGVFAGEANTNLYKKLIDTQTREIDLGAKGIYSYADDLPGNPVYFGLTDVSANNLTAEKAQIVQQKILDEFQKIANFKDSSPELKEFNQRFSNSLTDTRRSLAKFVNTPPGFGFRSGSGGYGWLWRTRYLDTTKDFRKSVTYKPEIAEIEKMLTSSKNFWRDFIARWRFDKAKPFVAVARANPKLIEQEEDEKKTRAKAEIAVLKKKYNVSDDQEAIRRYQAEYDKTTAELEKLEQSSARKFISNPPLTLDDQLDYKVSKLGNLPFFSANFDNMTGATSGIALRTDTIAESDLVYLTVLPTLLRQVGVIKDGKPITFEEMSELLRKEILSLNVYFANNYKTNRYEMVVRGAGNNLTESARSVEWMKTILQNPNWRKENLPRIRDIVDQALSNYRRTMQNSEENWVTNPSTAYQRQNSLLYLSTASVFTQSHNFQRFRWMLKETGDARNMKSIFDFLNKLSEAKGNREELKTLVLAIQGDKAQAEKVSSNLKSYLTDFAALPETARNLAIETAKDLDQTLGDIPDGTLNADWKYLCRQMRQDLAQTPEKTLANLDKVRRELLNSSTARMFYIGSRTNQTKLSSSYNNLLNGFSNVDRPKANYAQKRYIEERVKSRYQTAEKPIFVGLIAPNMTGGVLINDAPLVSYSDTDREKLLEFLASRIYGGSGPKSVYTVTLNAGLAYSNGVRGNVDSGYFGHYAERTPELPQTLSYVINEIKKPYLDAGIGDYCIALAFSSRASSPYESRGEAMAANLVDGVTPEVVSNFRKAILELRKMPNLSAELVKRKDKVYERILPGYGIKGKDVAGANYFVIGAEKQMVAYENYLKEKDSPQTKLYRIYPRDFWMTLK